jgi:excisionase family DNA binding protein
MKRFLVEVRLGYDVRANTADEALRLVSPRIQDDQTIDIEYSVRERQEPVAPKEKAPDLHGLTKPVYTMTEVASILGTSRSSVYELARRGTSSARLGRRVLIPGSTLVAFLNGELPLKEGPQRQQGSACAESSPLIRHAIAPWKRQRHRGPRVPVRFGGLCFGNQHAIDAIGSIESYQGSTHRVRTIQAKRIENRQLSLDLRFEQFARDRS